MKASPKQMDQTFPSNTYPFSPTNLCTEFIKFQFKSNVCTTIFSSLSKLWATRCSGSSPFTTPMQKNPDQLLFHGSQCITGLGISMKLSTLYPVSYRTSLFAFYLQSSSSSRPEGNQRTNLLTGGLKLAMRTTWGHFCRSLYLMTGITSTPSTVLPLFLVVVRQTLSQLGTWRSPMLQVMYLRPIHLPSKAGYQVRTLLSLLWSVDGAFIGCQY